jgi:hypothetical protein
MDDKVYDEPGEAEAVEGNVALMGPDGVSAILTPEAAEETSHRLLDSAMIAQGQRAEAARKAEEPRGRSDQDRD